MTNRGMRYRGGWAVVVGAVFLSAIAGFEAYQLGLRRGGAGGLALEGFKGFGFGFPLLILAFLWFGGLQRLAFGQAASRGVSRQAQEGVGHGAAAGAPMTPGNG